MLLLLILLAGCTASRNQAANDTDNQPGPSTLGEQPAENDKDQAQEPTSTSGPDCYGPEIHPVGESIAEQFEDTSYEQVMVWFCNGALFDDILTALQTEKLTGEDAESLLDMLGAGLTWDQIWVEIGLTEE